MKTKHYFYILALFLLSQISKAQVQLDTVYVNSRKSTERFIGIRYYYYPNLQAYFDTRNTVFIYINNGEWISSDTISPSYRGYCLKNGFFVELKDLYEDQPYKYIEQHKQKYPADFSGKRKPKAVATVN